MPYNNALTHSLTFYGFIFYSCLPETYTITHTYNIQPLPRNIRNRNSKFNKNITKRGNVDPGKVAERDEDGPRVSPALIAFFMVIVFGSSLVQVFNLFGGGKSKPPAE
jgi:hypothetical protein